MKNRILPWLLISLAMLSLAACTATSQAQSVVSPIQANELKPMLQDSSITVIDVRTPEEISEGYMEGADLFLNYNDANFEQQLAALNKSKTYVVYCRSGGRSSSAAAMMEKTGFTKVYNLQGGISGWDGKILRK
ncbi:MAG: rhodanese-like domain-containing protein [Cytophagaceae bacterium]|jgi:rhodanese-related sulfurtransferase|nr:rhodanese-like domain-containing protein [Cytophagaceae bacterium]